MLNNLHDQDPMSDSQPVVLEVITAAFLDFYRNRHQTMRTMLQSLLCQKTAVVSVNQSEYLEYQVHLNEHTFFRKSKVKLKH